MTRNTLLAAALAAALLTVTAMVVISQTGASDDAAPAAESAHASDPYAGIPQKGIALGRADAPLTLVEFADLQCPYCRDYAVGVLSQLVDRYVRTGELRLELHVLRFLGHDSVSAAAAASAAAQQDRMWQFTDRFFREQGAENSGYVTSEFLESAAAGAGLDTARMERAIASGHTEGRSKDAEASAERLGVQGTPAFYLGRTGGELRPVEVSALELDQFAAAIEAAR